jgi:hypothetical protein
MAEIAETRFGRVGDVDIACRIAGAGAAGLVFVPGWVPPLEVSRELPECARLLERLAGTALKFPDLWTVVSVFLRAGHGLAACWPRRRDGIRWSLK